MEVRCQNCDARLSVPSVGPTKKTRCPHCGTMILIHSATLPTAEEDAKHAEKRDRAASRRVFEPIPRAAAYAGGLLLILLILSPFWASGVLDFFQHNHVFFGDALQPTNSLAASGRDLTLFGGVRLDSRREELEKSFNLILQNTRGIRPEIYEGKNAGDVLLINADFYDGVLKETTLIMRARPVLPEVIEQELIQNFGEPQTRTDETSGTGRLGLNSLHIGSSQDDLAGKLASFPRRRALLWMDGKVRVDALIYFNDSAPSPVSAMLQIHLAATEWLQANQPALRPVGLRHE